MIGVIATPPDVPVVREFFELLKTPWEFYRHDGRYEVLLCCGDFASPETTAKLAVVYAGRRTALDERHDIGIASETSDPRFVPVNGTRIPIYGDSITFREGVGDSAVFLSEAAGIPVVRIGYDLLREVRTLLTVGQPAANAAIPTLDLHISLLRDVIVGSGASLAEVPPVPAGYRFIACLTHDVDHPLLRRHGFDHTTFGFLYRATLGSLSRLLRGRLPLRGLLDNWAAAAKLPLVYLNLARDFWGGFDRYQELERGAASTFFVLPFEGRAGRGAPARRAAKYGASDIADRIAALSAAGCEIGLHGVDAWCDETQGRAEVAEIRRITGQTEIGVRMHWLYFDERSPAILEQAGIAYDSTVGYNETVGYRAGTTQVYRPLAAQRLLELPLHVMDTALFYPGYLALSPEEAWGRVGRIIDTAVEVGGCVTLNWHDRSIAPERHWGDFYAALVGELRDRGAWLASAAQTVAWFRKRRCAEFERIPDSNEVRIRAAADNLPGLQLRIHNPAQSGQTAALGAAI